MFNESPKHFEIDNQGCHVVIHQCEVCELGLKKIAELLPGHPCRRSKDEILPAPTVVGRALDPSRLS